ncbi:hypothetical protein GMOD_00009031 [Pyrenophora seminiperda CCB06]|uniref:Uncharacterized protein n=1 Tax=Pyrenophora seminiperda CCB06 TaxID=1302712 RepID=A0A3M7MFD2_9PLEO|nr:hypothetical protein GMOD_00009031 [Pyrenophora seminiperda CCB06]
MSVLYLHTYTYTVLNSCTPPTAQPPIRPCFSHGPNRCGAVQCATHLLHCEIVHMADPGQMHYPASPAPCQTTLTACTQTSFSLTLEMCRTSEPRFTPQSYRGRVGRIRVIAACFEIRSKRHSFHQTTVMAKVHMLLPSRAEYYNPDAVLPRK